MNLWSYARGVVFAVVVGSMAVDAASGAQKTFYMDEGTHYSDVGMCGNIDLNTVTASLADTMRADGWTGSRYVNELAWPQDYRDKTLDGNGLDQLYGDAASLTVFAGHGGAGLLTFRPRLGVCTADAGSNMALGYGSTAGTATVGMWLSCDMLATGLLDESTSSYRKMNIRQSLGWLNSIGIGDDEPRDFYNATRSTSNANAWLRQMQGHGRQPIVLTATTANSVDVCWFFHGNESLGQGAVDHLSGDWAWRCWEWIEYD